MKVANVIRMPIYLTIIIFSIISCSTAQTNHDHEHEAQSHNESTSPDDHEMHTSQIPKAQAEKVLNAYIQIKDALVKTDGETASLKAAQLVEILGDSKDEIAEKIRFDATHIADTKDPGHQRDHFNTLSDNVYALVKATKANESTIYRQYCPMAFNNQGAFWLASEKEINNPYFGNKMLHCGSVKESF